MHLSETDHTRGARILSFLERKDWVLALAIVLLGFLLGLRSLGLWWINPDEGIYYSIISSPDSETFWNEITARPHPPLYWLILRFLGFLTTDFVWYRAFSLVCGCVAIFAAFLVGKELAGSGVRGSATGLIAALLIAASPGVILLSQVIRPYMLQLASLSLAVFYIVRYLDTRNPRGLIGYALFLSVALLTHYSSFFGFGVIGTVLLGHLVAKRFVLIEVRQLAAAHVVPVLVVFALYFLHLRGHVATSSLQGWLAPYMIRFAGDVWSLLLGFQTFLLGPHLAAPGIVVLVAGVGLAARRRCGTVAGLTLAALGIALLCAATGKYPFGCTRHSVWAIAFVVPAIAWMLGVAVTSRRWILPASLVLVGALVLTGEQVCRALDTSQASIEPQVIEQCLTRSDFDRMLPVLSQGDESGIMLLTAQSYYTLVPLFRAELGAMVRSPDGSYFHFRWGDRDVVVLNSWRLSVRTSDIGKKSHLHTIVQKIDREKPRLGLGGQSKVLMILAGWSNETLQLLRQANAKQPAESRLISNWRAVPGLYAFDFNLAAYMSSVKTAPAQRNP